MLARVGQDLGAIKGDVPEFEQLHLARQHQYLHEQHFDLFEEAPAKCGQRVMVGVGVGGHIAKGDRVVGCPLDFAA